MFIWFLYFFEFLTKIFSEKSPCSGSWKKQKKLASKSVDWKWSEFHRPIHTWDKQCFKQSHSFWIFVAIAALNDLCFYVYFNFHESNVWNEILSWRRAQFTRCWLAWLGWHASVARQSCSVDLGPPNRNVPSHCKVPSNNGSRFERACVFPKCEILIYLNSPPENERRSLCATIWAFNLVLFCSGCFLFLIVGSLPFLYFVCLVRVCVCDAFR